MSDTGVLAASACSDDSGIGSRSWSNPTNAQGAQNGTVATVDLSSGFGNVSHYLIAAFTHGLDPADTITGIVAAFYRSATLMDTDPPADSTIKLVKNGVVSGTNKSAGGDWPQVAAWSGDYGGAADTWGLSLSGADTIGLAISCTAPDPNDSAEIDAVRMTIYYTTVTPAGRLLARQRHMRMRCQS